MTATTPADLKAMIDSDMTITDMSKALNITRDAVMLRLRRAKLYAPSGLTNTYTVDEVARAIELLDEGMPATWVAEDIGRDAGRLREKLPPDPDAVKEWKSVWGYIKNRPELMALHDEFKPRVGRRVYDLKHAETPNHVARGSGVGEDAPR